MIVTFKFIANNNDKSQIRSLEALKDNIERIRKNTIPLSTMMTRGILISNIEQIDKKAYFTVVYRDFKEGYVDEKIIVAKISHPEKVAFLLYRLSELIGVDDYLRIAPEKLFLSYQKDEEYTLDGILFKIQTELKQSSSPSVKYLQIRIMAHDLITGSNCDKTFAPSQNKDFVTESFIKKSINSSIKYMIEEELRRK